ncbi:MAG: [protein-PII] uridylyltransferase [Geminicoccaceae bacterium]
MSPAALLKGYCEASEPPSDADLLAALRQTLQGTQDARRQAFEAGGPVEDVVLGNADTMDGLVSGLVAFAQTHPYPRFNLTQHDRLSVVAVGGYGRGEMAPHSDVDLLFLLPYKRGPHSEQVLEYLLYKLWDLGLHVGQATRTVTECLRGAREDLTIATSLLEARLVCGDPAAYQDLRDKLRGTINNGSAAAFIEAKLAERDERLQRVGDSRYLLEPNVKEGKGALRDLHTVGWLGRFIYGHNALSNLVSEGVFDRATYRTFVNARRFFWQVRCHLHYLTGRPEERLTFDLQPEIAARMGYRDRPNARGVERFMKRYYLYAKDVGNLTRIICAALEDAHKRTPRLRLPRFSSRSQRVGPFEILADRVRTVGDDVFASEPRLMLALFQFAQARDLDIHPLALKQVTENLNRIDASLRADPQANDLFMAMLTGPRAERTLRWLNEAGVLGRFLPEFKRIIAQMQYNLYHVYTTDEHSIRAVGVLEAIERGEAKDIYPLSSEVIGQIEQRNELHLATFLHDVGKGYAGDHSIVGEKLVRKIALRLGMNSASADTVAWLVRHHLLLSTIAFRRDIEDPQTIRDVVAIVQSPERLKLLLLLTVVDISAVGPGVWNGWKGQLLRDLYHEVAASFSVGKMAGRRAERVEAAKEELWQVPGLWPDRETFDAYAARHDPRFWLSVDSQAQQRLARLVLRAESEQRLLDVTWMVDSFRSITEVLVHAPDHPGLFMKIAGALAVSGASIVGARVFTTTDGMALDMFEVQDIRTAEAVEDATRLERMRGNIEKAMAGELWLERALEGARVLPTRADVFTVEPRVLINNKASRAHTVVEVNGRDRPGFLFDVAKGLMDCGLVIASAHIATYGERVVDVFYVKDVFGLKIVAPNKLNRIRQRLIQAIEQSP